MNSFEEIVRLKNLVAEKVKVIGIMEKERTGMQKLHRQYQKERTDQESMETEYGERMRRVNEDLRVAKGLILMCIYTHTNTYTRPARGQKSHPHAPPKVCVCPHLLQAVGVGGQ